MASPSRKRNPARSMRGKRDFTYTYVRPEQLTESEDDEEVSMPVVRNLVDPGSAARESTRKTTTKGNGGFFSNQTNNKRSGQSWDVASSRGGSSSMATTTSAPDNAGKEKNGTSQSRSTAARQQSAVDASPTHPEKNGRRVLSCCGGSRSGTQGRTSQNPAQAQTQAQTQAQAPTSSTAVASATSGWSTTAASQLYQIIPAVSSQNALPKTEAPTPAVTVQYEAQDDSFRPKTSPTAARIKRKHVPLPRARTPAQRFAPLLRVNFTLPNSEEDAETFLRMVDEFKEWCRKNLHGRCEATRAYIRSLHKGASRDNPFEVSDDDMDDDAQTISSASSCSQMSTARSSPFDNEHSSWSIERRGTLPPVACSSTVQGNLQENVA